KPSGRIPLPVNAHELWAHHKYSVLARDPQEYQRIGRSVANMRGNADFSSLAAELVDILRLVPPTGRVVNALDHMWGYVASYASEEERSLSRCSPAQLLETIAALVNRIQEPYLSRSTALSELAVYIRDDHVDMLGNPAKEKLS